jgi:hypothetical protein
MQPIEVLEGCVCFKPNAIVQLLLDESSKRGFSLNDLSLREFTQVDWEQFYQLIGYAVNGYHELSNVSDESALAASKAARKVSPNAGGCRDGGCPIHCGVEKEK